MTSFSKVNVEPRKKYGNKPVWFYPKTNSVIDCKIDQTCIYFDSLLELRCWKMLVAMLGESEVLHHCKIHLKPETKNYPQRNWEVDFAIQLPNGLKYIEVKGNWIHKDSGALRDFRNTIECLELFNPMAWENLIIVSDTASQMDKVIPTITLEALATLIKMELK